MKSAGVVMAVLLLAGCTSAASKVASPSPAGATSAQVAPSTLSNGPTTSGRLATVTSSVPAIATTPAHVVASPSVELPDSVCLTAAQALAQFVTPHVPGATVDTVHGYACSDGWAYVNYVWPEPHADHSTVDLQYVAQAWVVANRSTACGTDGTSPMPAAIFAYGCGN